MNPTTVYLKDFDIHLEYTWVGLDAKQNPNAPLLVFLHEGLGSVAMWKDFPQQLCQAGGFCGLVYSRYGYGHSTPRPLQQIWQPNHLQTQAEQLSAVLTALDIDPNVREPWLFGHSDGGSIALLYAAQHPDTTAGIVVLAPHTFVEPMCIESIQGALKAYQTTDLKQKLSRFHADVDSAFYGWNGMWLNPAFLAWDIRAQLTDIVCPVLAIQGYDDPYGTMAHIDSIKSAVGHTRLLKIADCGHSPHRDATQPVIEQTVTWLSAMLA